MDGYLTLYPAESANDAPINFKEKAPNNLNILRKRES